MINFSDILGQAPAALIPMEHELLELLKKFLAFQFEIPNDKIWVSISADDDEPVAGIKEGAVIGRFNGRLMLPPEISLQKMDRKIWLEQLQKFAEDIKSEIMIADNDDKVFKVFKFTIFVPSIELPPEFEGPKKEEPKKEPPKPYEEGKEETEEETEEETGTEPATETEEPKESQEKTEETTKEEKPEPETKEKPAEIKESK